MSYCAKNGKEMGLYIETVDNLLVNITADGATLQHPKRRGCTAVLELETVTK